ncbi:MAG: hypothetical protein L3J33_07085 [Rhodobacteraceae bacterium]|nr:hypothetical protein [Paracoccaceae bacterium]
MVKRIVILGHSHVNALRGGAQLVDGINGGAFTLEFLQIHTIQKSPTLSGAPPYVMDPHLDSVIRDSLLACDALLLLAYGKEHNNLGLINHPRKFDFFLSEDSSLFVDDARELIPEEFVKSQLRFQTAKLASILDKIRKMAPESLPVFQLECPTPIPSEAHIIKYAGPYKERIDELGVAPSHLRYKLWRLFCQLAKEYCAASDIEYVPIPEHALDENGFMSEEYWQVDPTHGNAIFGKAVLENFIYNILGLEKEQ